MKKTAAIFSFLLLSACSTVTVSKESSLVTANYDRPMDEWLSAGKYQRYQNSNQDKYDLNLFKSEKTGKAVLEMRLICFKRTTRPSKVMKKLDSLNVRPANLQELFSYLEKYPSAANGRAIQALGSIHVEKYGQRRAPCVWSNDHILGIDWLGSGVQYNGRIDETAYFYGTCFVTIPK